MMMTITVLGFGLWICLAGGGGGEMMMIGVLGFDFSGKMRNRDDNDDD
jgi:hypothetical protein